MPKEARKRVYDYYFAPEGVPNAAIVAEGKRHNSKIMYAKLYAAGSKDRVGLLRVNKEVYEEAIQILYSNTIQFESTSTLSDFLVQLDPSLRARLTGIVINTWIKTTCRTAMMLLAEARNIKSLKIDSSVLGDEDPAKAAKTFWSDGYKFLDTVGSAKGDKSAAVDVLSFGRKAPAEGKKKPKAHSEEYVEEFKDNLKGKLK